MDLGLPHLSLGWRSEFGLVIALAATYLLYFVFRKRDELGKHAAENTSATLVVAILNLILVYAFLDEVNAAMQATYDRLRIPTLDPHVWDGLPLWAVTILAIVVKDFVDYWNHRAMHMKWLWPTHAAHHTDTHVNAFTAYRIHFLETLFMNLTYIVLLTWLQMPGVIPVVAFLSLLHNQYVHMDLPFTHGPFRYLIASPVFHRWHHADVPEAYGKNLANVIPLYDVIFGTYYNPGPCRAPLGALKMGLSDKNPFRIYVYPVLRWAELLREHLPRRGRIGLGEGDRADG